MLRLARTGAAWRDLLEALGNWNSTFCRFWRWADNGVFERLFTALSADLDVDCAIIDATIVRVHQHAGGGKGGLRLRPLGVLSAA